MKLIKKSLIIISLFCLTANFALAQESTPTVATTGTDSGKPASEAPIQRGKRSVAIKLNYDNELVMGSAAKPDIDNISMRKSFNFKKIIRVRENFLNEMEDSVDSFKAN